MVKENIEVKSVTIMIATPDEILSALATSGRENGLNEDQRTVFSLYTSAAAVTYLCPDQKDKYKRDS